MAVVRGPFTGGNTGFLGTYPYFGMPSPQSPSVRSQAYPPIIAPARGAHGYRKTALPSAVTGTFQAAALVPQGPTTYGVGSGTPIQAGGTSGTINTG